MHRWADVSSKQVQTSQILLPTEIKMYKLSNRHLWGFGIAGVVFGRWQRVYKLKIFSKNWSDLFVRDA